MEYVSSEWGVEVENYSFPFEIIKIFKANTNIDYKQLAILVVAYNLKNNASIEKYSKIRIVED